MTVNQQKHQKRKTPPGAAHQAGSLRQTRPSSDVICVQTYTYCPSHDGLSLLHPSGIAGKSQKGPSAYRRSSKRNCYGRLPLRAKRMLPRSLRTARRFRGVLHQGLVVAWLFSFRSGTQWHPRIIKNGRSGSDLPYIPSAGHENAHAEPSPGTTQVSATLCCGNLLPQTGAIPELIRSTFHIAHIVNDRQQRDTNFFSNSTKQRIH